MPFSGTALLVAVACGLLVYGGGKLVHGVKRAAHAVAHVVHHPKKKDTPAK